MSLLWKGAMESVRLKTGCAWRRRSVGAGMSLVQATGRHSLLVGESGPGHLYAHPCGDPERQLATIVALRGAASLAKEDKGWRLYNDLQHR